MQQNDNFADYGKMAQSSCGSIHDIEHFVKVWAYAKTIGELESLDSKTQFILEAAAITHDIACPLCRAKYGNAGGKLQEKESPSLIRDFFADTDLDETQVQRLVWLVSHHHTYENIDGPDWQILIEADYIVKYSPCQGQSNLTPWKTAANHGRLQMPAIGG